MAKVELRRWSNGDASAHDQLAVVLERELRRLARLYLSREAAGHTLQPTALVNEAYLRLLQSQSVEWQDRVHFLAVAAKMMRRILVNHALAKRRQKRSAVLVSLTEAGNVPGREEDLIALDEALLALSKFDERKARLVELRYFGGLTAEETAAMLGTSLRTVTRDWDLARAWLLRALRG